MATHGIGDGRKVVATAGTREPLVPSGVFVFGVAITALEGNAGAVVVGGDTVVANLTTRSGTPLNPRDSVDYDVNDLRHVWVDVVNSGDGVSFSYTGPDR